MTATTLWPLLYGFALLLVFFVLLNVDRRFRDHVSRSLLRPFNFFADLRDRRVLPNTQVTLLAFVLAGSQALCIGSLLRHAYTLSATNHALSLLMPVGWREWSLSENGEYFMLLIWLTTLALAGIFIIALGLRFIGMFRRGRIMIGDTYNLAVWSVLPIVLLLPYDIVLPRMDNTTSTLGISTAILIVITIWIYYRLLKGAGVLFDVYPTRLYVYGTFVLLVIAVSILAYLQSLHLLANFF